MIQISTSILSVKQERAINTFYELEVAHTDFFHIDIMDGSFVKENTNNLMKEYANTIKHISNLPLDVHLMVNDIKEYIDEYISLQPSIITFHLEATKNKEEVLELIKYIKDNGIKVGISIKPETNIDEIFEYLPFIHLGLIMTVEPGYGGQDLIPETLNKIKMLKKHITEHNLDLYIEADGGINLKNASKVIESGADILVCGTSIINSDNYKQTIKQLKV